MAVSSETKDRVVYGLHAVKNALNERPETIAHVYVDRRSRSPRLFEITKQCRRLRLPCSRVPDSRIRAVAGTSRHQGVTARCILKPFASLEEVHLKIASSSLPLLLVPASVEDPGNLGSLIRSAAAFGADAVLVERAHTAPLNAAVAKSSAGALEKIPVCRPRNLAETIRAFSRQGYAVTGAEPGSTTPPWSADMRKPTILITGGEHRGIPPYLRRCCTRLVGIPMSEKGRSLNVGVAVGILLYESIRQRSSSGEDGFAGECTSS